ncbi:N-alpha-acetyltransferase, non-catalitic subunit [Pleosporales sp. CAS-2024a]
MNMADPPTDGSTAPDTAATEIAPYDAAVPTHVYALGSNAQTSTPADLPLRQSLKTSQNAHQPKLHDITEKFTKASNALNVGQLVKDEYFTLFESIGAIEIMDPKMDSGFLQPGETLEDDYDTLKPLLPQEIIGIMDQLLCHEMAWHTGYPLSQTLFTSVYIDRLLWPEPLVLEQAQFYRGDITDEQRPGPLLQVLRAYCVALVKSCDYVIAKITGRDYFEEEDFCTHTYNRVLLVGTPLDYFMAELDVAVEVMQDTDMEVKDTLRSAIIARLEFRKDFLRALDLDLTPDLMSRSWPPVLNGIQTVKSTHELGQAVPGAFSTKMQRRLASTVPPRPIVELEFRDAVEKLLQITTDCEEATRFSTLPQDPLEYQSFLWYFASRSPPPLAYARSYLASLLFHPDVLHASVPLPLVDLRTLVFPSSSVLDASNWACSPPRDARLPKPPRLQLAMLIDEFIDRSGSPYMNFWVALGQNRCRLRRMLTHVIAEWDMFQGEAAAVDEDIHLAADELQIPDQVLAFSLSTWCYHKKLWMIEKVLLLGFEQDIYLPDEFAGMYLFLSLIATRRNELLKKIEAHYLIRASELLRSQSLGEVQEVKDASLYIDSLMAEAKGVAHLALALARSYMILLYLGLVPIPRRPFSTEALRYELRMKPFLSLQPPEVPPFEDFMEHTQPYGPYACPSARLNTELHQSNSELWTDIDMSLKGAKDAFAEYKKLGAVAAKAQGVEKEWTKDVQSVLASCIALGVAVAGIKDAVMEQGGDGKKKPGVKVDVPASGAGKRYAEGWVIVKVSKE